MKNRALRATAHLFVIRRLVRGTVTHIEAAVNGGVARSGWMGRTCGACADSGVWWPRG